MYSGQRSSPLYHTQQNVQVLPNTPDSQHNMDGSQFNHYAYPFQGLPDQATFMTIPEESQLAHLTPPTNESFNYHRTLASAPNHLDSPTGAVPRAAFNASLGGTNSSQTGSEDGDRKSPISTDPHEDAAADDFELSSHQHRTDGTDMGNKAQDKEEAMPSWSELKTKAGKERKRLPLACISCRRKKIRCSGEKPSCKHCLRSRIPCVYKVTTRKAAPRTDYMAMLDKRLKRMEERIIKVVPESDQTSTSSVVRAVVKPAIPGTLSSTKASAKKRGLDDAFGSNIDSWTKGVTKAKADADDLKAGFSENSDEDEDTLFKEGRDALPTKELQEHLAEVFFDNVYGQAYHLLHKPSYMRKLRSDSLPPVLVLSVCAIAARFAATPKLNSSTRQFLRGEEWASHARAICTRRYEWPNITILTCLLILGLHEFGTCQGGRSWALGGQAIRMAFALQLHKDLAYDPMARNGKVELSFIDREIRRRIMWACFLMDRFNSSGTDRPMFIKDDTIGIPLPVKERYFQLDMPATTETLDGRVLRRFPEEEVTANVRDNMGVAAYLIRAVAIWGRIVSYVNHGGWKTDSQPKWNASSEFAKLIQEAEKFLASLPESMGYSSDNLMLHNTENTANQFLLLHIAIQHNILFLNRAALSEDGEGGTCWPAEYLEQVRAKATTSANRISDYLREAEGSRYLVSAPFAGYCAFSSATLHIHGMFSDQGNTKGLAENNSGVNIKYLRKMMKYWGTFHLMVENIRAQYRTALDAGGREDDKGMKLPILQYGDWFDRFPHGVSDAEAMDPQKKKDKGGDAVLEQKPELHTVEQFFTTISPPASKDDKPEGTNTAGTKRKATQRKQSVNAGRPGPQLSQPKVSSTSSINGQDRAESAGPPPTQRRRISAAHATPSIVPKTHNPNIQHPQVGPFSQMSSMPPINGPNFTPHLTTQPDFYTPDMLGVSLAGHHQNTLVQPMDRSIQFGGYSMVPGGMDTAQNLMNVPGWNGVSGSSTPGGSTTELGVQDLSQNHFGMNQLPNNVDDGPAWLMPFEMAHTETGQDMGLLVGGSLDPYGGMFASSGMSTPNPLSGLRHGHG